MRNWLHRLRHRLGWAPSLLHEVLEDGTMILFCVKCGRFTEVPYRSRRQRLETIV